MLLQNRRKAILVVLIVIAAVFISVLLITPDKGGDIDRIPPDESSEEVNYSIQAYIVDGAKFFDVIDNVNSYDSFGKDLYAFAKPRYDKYKSLKYAVIGFKIASDIKKNGNVVTLQGRFGATKNIIDVKIKLLKNGRINTSITDKKTSFNADSSLPSNTKRNQFIGTLPLETKDYIIDYLARQDSFTVNVFNGVSNFEVAKKVIEDALGTKSLEGEEVIQYGVGERNPENVF